MWKIVSLIVLCILPSILISGCSTIDEIRRSEIVDKVGSFELNPVKPNNYWYNGTSYEYNSYEITIDSTPVKAHIKWNGKYIGDTPMVYSHSGFIERGEHVRIKAIPTDEKYPPQEAVLKVIDELPREIMIDLDKNLP